MPLHLIVALCNLGEVLGFLGVLLGLYGLVRVAQRLSDEASDVAVDMVELFEIGRARD